MLSLEWLCGSLDASLLHDVTDDARCIDWKALCAEKDLRRIRGGPGFLAAAARVYAGIGSTVLSTEGEQAIAALFTS